MSDFVTGASSHTVNDCVLSAMNCGELYADFVRLINQNATPEQWVHHYSAEVVPVIFKLGCECRYSERREVAGLLRSYYIDHVAENA